MHDFTDIDEIESVLERMAEWKPDPLVVRLPRLPGTREPRYMHLLAPYSEPAIPVTDPRTALAPAGDDIAALRAIVTRLEEDVRQLRAEFTEFRKQFD